MLEEIVGNILKTEEAARAREAAARQQAQVIIMTARHEAAAWKSLELARSRRQRDELLREAQAAAKDKQQKIMDDARRESEEMWRLKSLQIESLAREVFEQILRG